MRQQEKITVWSSRPAGRTTSLLTSVPRWEGTIELQWIKEQGLPGGEKEGKQEENTLASAEAVFFFPPLPRNWNYGLDYIRYASPYLQICSYKHPTEPWLLAKPLNSVYAVIGAKIHTAHESQVPRILLNCISYSADRHSMNAERGFPEIFSMHVISKDMFGCLKPPGAMAFLQEDENILLLYQSAWKQREGGVGGNWVINE